MAWEEYSRSKWEIIANNMIKYGCPEKWPKELVQKKWQELNPNDNTACLSDYEVKWGVGQRDWSDGRNSRSHSLEGDGSAQYSKPPSSTAMKVSRSRTASNTASPPHFPESQQQMMFESQQEHGVWATTS